MIERIFISNVHAAIDYKLSLMAQGFVVQMTHWTNDRNEQVTKVTAQRRVL